MAFCVCANMFCFFLDNIELNQLMWMLQTYLTVDAYKVPVTLEALEHYIALCRRTPTFITFSISRHEITIPPDFGGLQRMFVIGFMCASGAKLKFAGPTHFRQAPMNDVPTLITDLISLYEILSFAVLGPGMRLVAFR